MQSYWKPSQQKVIDSIEKANMRKLTQNQRHLPDISPAPLPDPDRYQDRIATIQNKIYYGNEANFQKHVISELTNQGYKIITPEPLYKFHNPKIPDICATKDNTYNIFELKLGMDRVQYAIGQLVVQRFLYIPPNDPYKLYIVLPKLPDKVKKRSTYLELSKHFSEYLSDYSIELMFL